MEIREQERAWYQTSAEKLKPSVSGKSSSSPDALFCNRYSLCHALHSGLY